MKHILITGGSGFIGSHLTNHLLEKGYQVTIVSRNPDDVKNRANPLLEGANVISWDDNFPEVEVAIHLVGTLIDKQRWSTKFIKELIASRTQTARALQEKLTKSCKLVISASGSNCYPIGEAFDENGPYGEHVSAEICRKWEGVWTHWPERFVAMRIGVVLGPSCPMLKKLLPIYKAGLGGVIGSGQQRMSWVAIDDLVRMFEMAIENEDADGPINAVAPKPNTFKEFNDALARATKRPAFWRIPGWLMRAMAGQMADELILADSPVIPQALSDLGFEWQTSDIKQALEKAL